MEFFQRKRDHKMTMKRQILRVVEHPELSLGPSLSTYNATDSGNSSSSDHSDGGASRKRKHSWDDPYNYQASIDLQLINDPLPMDWEQCLDLQSGRMYYLNRKTLKKSWSRPKDHQEQQLDLELNISTHSTPSNWKTATASDSKKQEGPKKRANDSNHCSNSSAMVAVACQNCHLLVMLCRSSPSCPNCKYMHPLPAVKSQVRNISEATKPLETLSLLN